MQIKTAFTNAVQRLKRADIPEPELEVSVLLSHALKMERTAVLLAGEKILTGEEHKIFEKYVSRRLAREPSAYITGKKEFWSLDFKVTNDVLIPRPETEFLLEKALAVFKRISGCSDRQINILDLGTGSGVIAIILALELAPAKITAVDYSYHALKVARHNAEKHKVAEKIDFINSSWLDSLVIPARFDGVISNPPYIDREVLAKPFGRAAGSLDPEVGCFEPALALDGGEGGVQEIKKITAGVGKVLRPGGLLFLEIGADQEKKVCGIVNATGLFDCIEIFNDYSGMSRVFQARRC